MLSPETLLRAYPDVDFLVAEGRVSSGYMVAIHRAFYEFAAQQVRGGRVLDAGCGTGFGSAFLARRAQHTVGIDLKDLLVLYGKSSYGGDGLDFVVADACRMGIAPEAFDAVVANELIEHLPDHRPFLREMIRVLRPGGLFVCATVNRVHTFGSGDDPLNRNHFREYDEADFRSELHRYFESVEVFGQGFGVGFERYMKHRPARSLEWLLMTLNVKHRIPAAWRARVRSWLTGVDPEEAATDDFSVSDQRVADSLYLVGVARKGTKT